MKNENLRIINVGARCIVPFRIFEECETGMNANELIKNEKIQSKIYTLRGVQVMLDKDLAIFYGVKPIRLREQVKRNIKRFPPDFMFQLTAEEVDFMVSQNAIPSKQHLGGSLPFVFTEQGVATISAVLTSERAININIQIMRAFVAMRRFIAINAKVFQRLDTVEQKQLEADKKFNQIFDALEERQIVPKKGIFFEGQIFDAHVLVSKIIRSAKKSIVIIDNYIDDLTIYHIGASLKDLGKKWFAFSKMDKEGLKLVDRLGKQQ